MENQTFKPDLSIQRATLVALAIVLGVLLSVLGVHELRMSEPYVKEVFAIHGNLERGHAIFQMNCAGCHGLAADGRVGPSLHNVSTRKSQLGLIHQVTSGQTPPMPAFQANPQDMADLLSYLTTL